MSERTVWFPAHIEPVRVGVYERKYRWGIGYAYFDGKDWALSTKTPSSALLWGKQSNMRSGEACKWRGLTLAAFGGLIAVRKA